MQFKSNPGRRGNYSYRFTPEEEAEIIRQYLTPLPDGTWKGANTIGTEFGARPQTIYSILKRYGVQTRNAKESHSNGKRCKPILNVAPAGVEPPTCACGCETPVKWLPRKKKWQQFVPGHRAQLPYRNRERLYMEYIVRHRTCEEIAQDFNVGTTVISRWLRTFGIPTRNRSEARIGRKAGKLNPAWKGGVTPERQRLYKSLKWRNLVRAVFHRDNYHCQRCGSPKVYPHPLHAHHITPWADSEALRFDMDNLVTLCHECHPWVHSLENEAGWFLAEALG